MAVKARKTSDQDVLVFSILRTAIPSLGHIMLHDADEVARSAAAQALRKIGDPDAKKSLLDALKDRHEVR